MKRQRYCCACRGCIARSLVLAMTHLPARPRVAFNIIDLLVADLITPQPSLCPIGRCVLSRLLTLKPSERRSVSA
jgi:hypothetical protein